MRPGVTGRPSTGPLRGVRVLDLTAMLAGPYGTMILADLGADVVKIEPPKGDVTRHSGPHRAGDSAEALAGYFQSVNRGKRSLVMDLRDEQTKQQFLDLVRNADILLENYSAGVMDRLGLGYETLREINPRLVYGTLRGFGDPRSGRSPYTDWPAFDVVAQAMGGFLGITGTADGEPIKSGPGVGDIFPGTLLALGVLAALRHAEHTGEGQFVDIAMYDAVLALCERAVYQYSYLDYVARPVGNSHPLLFPFDIFQTADGWVAMAAQGPNHWPILCEEMGRPDLVADPRFAENIDRVAHRDKVAPVVTAWVAQHTTSEIVEKLGGRVPVGPVNHMNDIYADPHVAAREMLVDVPQPGSDKPVTVAGVPLKFSGTPARITNRGPLLGEHNYHDVLAAWSGDSVSRVDHGERPG